MSNGIGHAIMNGVQTAAGIGSEIIAPGNPMGIGLTMNGINGFMGGGGSPSTGGFAAPGASGTPNLDALSGQLPSWLQSVPGVQSTPPIAGVSVNTGGPNPPPAATNWLSMLGGSNTLANLIGSAASAAGTVAKNQPGPPQQVQSYAPGFTGGGGQMPAFGAGNVIGPPIRNTITPPTPGQNYRLLQALGFQG